MKILSMTRFSTALFKRIFSSTINFFQDKKMYLWLRFLLFNITQRFITGYRKSAKVQLAVSKLQSSNFRVSTFWKSCLFSQVVTLPRMAFRNSLILSSGNVCPWSGEGNVAFEQVLVLHSLGWPHYPRLWELVETRFQMESKASSAFDPAEFSAFPCIALVYDTLPICGIFS